MFLKARITPTGGGFYTISGIIVKNGSVHNILSGTAYVRGNWVYMTTVDAGKDAVAMWTSTTYTVFNKNTLQISQGESIGHDKNYADHSLDTQYQKLGRSTPISCPSNW